MDSRLVIQCFKCQVPTLPWAAPQAVMVAERVALNESVIETEEAVSHHYLSIGGSASSGTRRLSRGHRQSQSQPEPEPRQRHIGAFLLGRRRSRTLPTLSALSPRGWNHWRAQPGSMALTWPGMTPSSRPTRMSSRLSTPRLIACLSVWIRPRNRLSISSIGTRRTVSRSRTSTLS